MSPEHFVVLEIKEVFKNYKTTIKDGTRQRDTRANLEEFPMAKAEKK